MQMSASLQPDAPNAHATARVLDLDGCAQVMPSAFTAIPSRIDLR